MKKIILPIVLIALLVPVSLFAGVFGKTGTASLQFLKLGVDARALGMGEAYTAVSDDISSTYWNPAGLAKKFDNQVFLSHTIWVADISHEYISASTETDYGIVALTGSFLHMDDMDVTDENYFGPTGKKFTSTDMAVGVSYANAFTDKFTFGMTAKYIHEDIDEETVDTYSVDLGTLYNTGFKNLTIGMALRNFGPDIKYEVDKDGDGQIDEDPFDLIDNDGDGEVDEDREENEFVIPMSFSLGVAMDVFRQDNTYLLASAQLDNCVDRQETWNLGAEYNYNKMFLRAGYQVGYDAAGYSFGFGVKVPSRMGTFNIDYAMTDMGRLAESFGDNAQRLSLKLSF